jgi:putative transposase
MAHIRELALIVGVAAACRAVGMPRSTYYRRQRPPALRPTPQPRRPHPRADTRRASSRARPAQ